METINSRNLKKCVQKQKRAHHRLLRDMNIKHSEEPTEHIAICNAGLVTGIQTKTLQDILDPLVKDYNIIMPPRKSYCFITFTSKKDSQSVYNKLHGSVKLCGQNGPLYLMYTNSVPSIDDDPWNNIHPPGLRIIENFVTETEELALMNSIDWSKEDSAPSELKHRKVCHFGYEFQYGTNNVNLDKPIAPIPDACNFLQELFEQHGCGQYKYDQLTVNRYLPGQGIPPHIDTHSAFEDTILSLSLGSQCTMDFKQEDRKVTVLLPQRSLLVMSGDARYAWNHGIYPRHNDVIKTQNGLTSVPRNTRVSFTFRKIHKGPCLCKFVDFCDSRKNNIPPINDTAAVDIEHSYVHQVYEAISEHFSQTRHKQWPNVVKFLDTLNKGDLLVDVGCGNGKYLHGNHDIFKMGCDRSSGLLEICRHRGFEVVLSDCLYLPYKDCSLDAAISIAVIHHLSTVERRKQAISEIIRVLRPNGKCLIYVWAKEQHKNSVESTYVRCNTKKNEAKLYTGCSMPVMTHQGVTLPVHTNRTPFIHNDMFVPWERKGGGTFLRYYHVFQENELTSLCSQIPDITVSDVYYDQGNWCIILRKK